MWCGGGKVMCEEVCWWGGGCVSGGIARTVVLVLTFAPVYKDRPAELLLFAGVLTQVTL